MVRKVRASLGTLGVLGLEFIQMETPPTTAYLQIYTDKRCTANCLFCAQAKGSSSDLTHIARGMYLPADLEAVVSRLKIAFERGYLARACIQTMLYDKWWEDTAYLIKKIRTESMIPISLSVFPLSDEKYIELRDSGVNELVIPLDACTRELFDKIKGKGAGGPYLWDRHMDGIKSASLIFESVGTHLIIGLGETDEEAIWIIDELNGFKVNTGLFSLTYIQGAQLLSKEGDIKHYRRVQLARYLITEGLAAFSEMRFSKGKIFDFGAKKDAILEIIEDGRAFQTSGCAGCNRPMANETFSMIYNFPRKLNMREKEAINRDIELV
jgi:biotin synthase-related radical SAM superfamily protein